MHIWINGQLVERDSATISASDAGLQHGIGLFETMAAHHGRVFRSEAHARRLVDSARELLLSDRLKVEPLAEAVQHVVDHNSLERARVRLTATGGDLGRLGVGGRRVDTTILIDAQLPTVYPDGFFEQGVMVVIAQGRANPMSPMAGHKTLAYWPRIHALQHAAARKAGEALWFTVRNHLAGGSVSNVFFVTDGVLRTPLARGETSEDGEHPPVLPGITRAAILELADARGLETATGTYDINDLIAADEIFLTNSSWGVLPVVSVERETIGTGEVGETTRTLREAWLELVELETGAPAA